MRYIVIALFTAFLTQTAIEATLFSISEAEAIRTGQLQRTIHTWATHSQYHTEWRHGQV